MRFTAHPDRTCVSPVWSPPASDITQTAECRLKAHCYLALRNISCEFLDGTLTLRGCLPTYYLKQMAQASVGEIEGVRRIVNEIEVMPSARTAMYSY